jgi:hypothetical protein
MNKRHVSFDSTAVRGARIWAPNHGCNITGGAAGLKVDSYPNDDDVQSLTEAHDLLAGHGVEPGPDRFGLDTLAAAAYAHGFAYRIDRAAGIGGYRVELRSQHGVAAQAIATGVGWKPEVAFAFALAQAIARRGAGLSV